jgi:polysaccharide biosynthesis protein PslG
LSCWLLRKFDTGLSPGYTLDMRVSMARAVLAVSAALCTLLPASAQSLPVPTVPEGFGVNIHFTDPQPGEMERFAEAGYRLARMDLFWGAVEKEKGKYDFSSYDRLTEHLKKAGARPLFILDYGNDLYQKGAPSTPEARAAFARFAAAAAEHYKGKGVLFEIWNEPNLAGFWPPAPDPKAYAALAVEAAKAIRAADPDAVILAPGSSGFPWEYFETVFEAGLLQHIDAVSVHPYRGQEPETASADFARLRGLIGRYAPADKRPMPIVSSEWGYSTVEGGVSEAKQASYLIRMWLANLASGVNLSIFYDWRDDGDNPKENEHRFGTVRRDFTPKPSFLAAQKLIRELNGFSFRHRLEGKRPGDWLLLFQKADTDELALVTWNTTPTAPEAQSIPTVRRVDTNASEYLGLRRLASVRFPYAAQSFFGTDPLTVPLDVVNPDANEAEVKLERIDRDQPGGKYTVWTGKLGPNDQEVKQFPLGARGPQEETVRLVVQWNGETLPALSPIPLMPAEPVTVTAIPAGRDLNVLVQSPAGKGFEGYVILTVQSTAGAVLREVREPVSIPEGTRESRLFLPLPKSGEFFNVAVRRFRGWPGNWQVKATPNAMLFLPLAGFDGKHGQTAPFQYTRFVENVSQKPEPLTLAATPDRSPAEIALRIVYQFDKGWQYAQATPTKPLTIPEGAKSLVLWVLADDTLQGQYGTDLSGGPYTVDAARLAGDHYSAGWYGGRRPLGRSERWHTAWPSDLGWSAPYRLG